MCEHIGVPGKYEWVCHHRWRRSLFPEYNGQSCCVAI